MSTSVYAPAGTVLSYYNRLFRYQKRRFVGPSAPYLAEWNYITPNPSFLTGVWVFGIRAPIDDYDPVPIDHLTDRLMRAYALLLSSQRRSEGREGRPSENESKFVHLALVSLGVATTPPNGVKVAFRTLQDLHGQDFRLFDVAVPPTVLQLWQKGLSRFPR